MSARAFATGTTRRTRRRARLERDRSRSVASRSSRSRRRVGFDRVASRASHAASPVRAHRASFVGKHSRARARCRPETYRAVRRATVGFAATLAPTKVEVEAERQKAIFSVWCLRSECGNGPRASPRGHHVAAKTSSQHGQNRFAKTTSANEIVSQTARFGDETHGHSVSL